MFFSVYVCGGQRTTAELSSLLSPHGAGNQTQVVRFGSNHLYLLAGRWVHIGDRVGRGREGEEEGERVCVVAWCRA